MELNDGCPMWP
jgi:hypothetical protein